MKIKKSISLENWLCQEILKRFPQSRHNFSAAVEGLLIASINNPLAYWKHQAKYHAQKMQLAASQVQLYEEMEREMTKDNKSIDVRNNILMEAIKNEH